MAYGVSNVHVIYDATRPQKVKLVSSIQLESAYISKTAGDAIHKQSLITRESAWGSTVGYPSDSLASCFVM